VAYATAAFVFLGIRFPSGSCSLSRFGAGATRRLTGIGAWRKGLSDANWYLIRTKTGKERWVRDQLQPVVAEVFLPMLRAKAPRWGRMTMSVGPLFPCYVFARFDLETRYFDVKYMAGVRGLVSAGTDPLVVPDAIVAEIRRRGTGDIVEIIEPPLGSGQRVTVVEGPFRGFEAVFDRYLSGAERVAILLNALESGGLRVVLPAAAVAKST
jgi:transcriptional antiterminator RfaH